ncbi:unnamed protein product [Chondrus crispus]|uniref:Secreted protein n=1 Tax=Chondrus crispus TaxID=2769 RepID=R7QL52_CHOCR|nr:unnamed protein product [Chondrus crispus]CDF38216.1 unnamed protein product [Chondrus crispus]|eukprot:XP_005718101.1 unnamed protein product [Chondrus crispus]
MSSPRILRVVFWYLPSLAAWSMKLVAASSLSEGMKSRRITYPSDTKERFCWSESARVSIPMRKRVDRGYCSCGCRDRCDNVEKTCLT